MTTMTELRAMDNEALQKVIVELGIEEFNLRMDTENQKRKTHRFGQIKKTIARIQTLLKERG